MCILITGEDDDGDGHSHERPQDPRDYPMYLTWSNPRDASKVGLGPGDKGMVALKLVCKFWDFITSRGIDHTHMHMHTYLESSCAWGSLEPVLRR